MNYKINKFINFKNGFSRAVLLSLAILLIPFISMQFTEAVSWTLADFIIMGILLLGFSSLFTILARRVPHKRIIIGILTLLLFFFVWAELAVGVFFGLGS